jgi:hypothetical protein
MSSNMTAPWQDRAKPAATAAGDALKLAANGLPVFPCLENKRPACPHGFKDATAKPAEVKQLWQRYPGVLVGVPTGEASGLFVLDLDTAKHPAADEWLERHSPYLPETRRHRTRSGGLHLVFRHRPGLKNSAGKLALGVDTRGEGGFIIWWPFHLGLWADHTSAPLAEVPEWLVEALTPAKVIPFPSRPSVSGPVAPRLEGIIGVVARAREGERNALTFWGACTLRDMVAARELTASEGARAFAALFEAGRHTGLSAQEIKQTIASATKAAR